MATPLSISDVTRIELTLANKCYRLTLNSSSHLYKYAVYSSAELHIDRSSADAASIAANKFTVPAGAGILIEPDINEIWNIGTPTAGSYVEILPMRKAYL
jgi:cysteine sulfinate desulfinase/cysteine desulfurase-like protein